MEKQVSVVSCAASLQWTIHKFMALEFHPSPIRSQSFSPPGSKDSWQLEAEMKGSFPLIRVFFQMRADNKTLQNLEVFVATQLTIGDFTETQESREEIAPNGHVLFEFSHTEWSTEDFLVTKAFESALVFCCIYYTPTDFTLEGRRPCGSSCLEDLKALLSSFSDSSLETDVTLIGADSESVTTHKFLLVARSEVFRRMFAFECEERKTCRINMIDFNSQILKDFVSFLRTDQVTDPASNAVDLFILGDKYAIPKLKAEAEEYLVANVGPGNQTRLLQLVSSIRSDAIEKALLLFLQQKGLSNADLKKKSSDKK